MRAKTGHEIAACGGRLSMCVRSARVPWAKAERSEKSIRCSTSAAVQRARRSALTVSRAASHDPSGFGARPEICALSICACRSMNAGQAMPARQSTDGRSGFGGAAGPIAAIRPSRMSMSTAQ